MRRCDRLGDGQRAVAGRIEHVDLPPAAVWVSAKAKLRQGAVTGQAQLYVRFPEQTSSFVPPAPARRKGHRSARPAMVGNDAAFIMECPPSDMNWADRRYLGAFRAQRIAIAGQSPRLPFACAGRGCAGRLGRFRRPCTEHRVHDLANIRGKNCFAENQESLELLKIGNS